MTGETCPRCGRPLLGTSGPPTDQTAMRETTQCAGCGAPTETEVVADPTWVETYTDSVEERADREDDAAQHGGLADRIGAQVELDPLTAATLIVAEEEKRIVE